MYKTRMMKVLLAVVAVISIHASTVYGASITGLSVDQQGNVGIGTNTPQSLLQLTSAASDTLGFIASGIRFENTDATFGGSSDIYLSRWGINWLTFSINDNTVFFLFETGDAQLTGTLYQQSDISLKENITEISAASRKIANLRGVSYDWKDKAKRGDRRQIGLIAQEVEQEFPEAVFTSIDGKKSIAYSRLVAPLIEAVKELKAENENMASELAALKSRVAALESQ